MVRRISALILLPICAIGIGVGAFLFCSNAYALGQVTVAPNTNNTDNLIGATNAQWKFTVTSTQDLARGDVLQFWFPNGISMIQPADQFVVTGASITATSGVSMYSSLGGTLSNLVTNPSFETGTNTPWGLVGYSSGTGLASGSCAPGVCAITSTAGQIGSAAFSYEIPSASLGFIGTLEMTATANSAYTVSYYAKGLAGGEVISAWLEGNLANACGGGNNYFHNFASSQWECAANGVLFGELSVYKASSTLSTSFVRHGFTFTSPNTSTYQGNIALKVIVGGTDAVATQTVYLDAVQFEAGAVSTTFNLGGSSADVYGIANGTPNVVYGYIGTTTASNTAFSVTVGAVSNPSGRRTVLQNLSSTVKAGGLAIGMPGYFNSLETEKLNVAGTSTVTRAGDSLFVDENTGVFLSSYTTSTAANYTFKITPTTSIPIGGKIVIEFPSDYASLLNSITVSTTQLISLGGTTTSTISAFTTSTSADGGRRIHLVVADKATVAGDPLSIVIYSVTNPATAGVYGADSSGPGNRFLQFTTKSNNGLLDGSLDPYSDGDFSGMGPPPPSSVTIGGKHTVNILVQMNTATTTRNLTTAEKDFLQVGMGNPDKGYFIGARRIGANSTAQYSGLLDGTYRVGAELTNKTSADTYSTLLAPGERTISLLSAAATTVTTTLYFGQPDTTTTITLTGGVVGQYASILASSPNYQSFAPIYTTATGTTQGFSADGNGYARVKVKGGETWSFNVMSGQSFGSNTNFSSGTSKFWPPSINSSYIATSTSGTTALGSFAYVEADKTLVVSLLYAGGSTPVTNACVGVKRSGGGMFMGAQDTVCQPNSGNNYQFKVPSGAVTVTISRPGSGQPAEYSVSISSVTTTKTIYLSGADNYINVTVQDSAGNAIRNASMFANGGGGFGQGMTGTNGTTTLFVPIGTYRVEGFAPGFGPLTAQTGVAVANGSNPSLTFTINTGNLRTVTGQVSVGGSGLAGVKIGARGTGSTTGGNGAETDSSGNYTLYLPAGTFEIGGWSPDTGGLSPQTVDVTSGNETGKDWIFTGGLGTVRVTINNSSNLSELFAGVFSTSTGRGSGANSWTASGTSKYADIRVPAGAYVVGAGSPITGPIIDQEAVTVTAGITTNVTGDAQASVTLKTISGTVSLDSSGVQNINVWASRLGTPRFFSVLTDASGNYSLYVPESGTYRVGIKTSGYVTSEGDVNVVVTTGSDFTLVAAGATITGQITSGGSAVTNAWVSAKKATGDTMTGAPTDANGNYTLNVDSGAWTVYAEGPGYERSTGTSTTAGSTNVNIALVARSGWSAPPPMMQGITDTSGGQVSNNNSTLDLPANALGTGSSVITVTVGTTTPRSAPNATALKNSTVTIAAQNSSGQAVSSLNSNATLSITLDAADLAELKIPESSLQFAYFDETSGQWEPMAATIDTVNHKVTVQTDHFTDFAPVIGGPDAPTGLTLATTTAGQIDLSWSAPIGSVSYYAIYATSTDTALFPTSTLIATSSATSYSHTSLTGGATWYYKVAGVNDIGEGPNSDRANATVVALGTPVTPTFSSIAQTTLTVGWTAVSGATSYNVYRGGTLVGSPSTNSYSDSGLTAATAYSYTVAAVNSNGAGSQSSAGSVTTLDNPSGGTGGAAAITLVVPTLGAAPASIVGAPTVVTSKEITLNLSATNADYVAISEDPNFVGAAWLSYSATKPLVLSDVSGVKKIYIKFRSASGGETAAQTVTVTYKSPTAPIITASSGLSQISVPVVALIGDSKIAISNLNMASFQPGASIKFSYKYINDSGKVAKIKIVRQLINSKNKVVKISSANKTLKKGENFTSKINEAMPNSLPAGVYTMKITIYDAKNKIVDKNSFKVEMEKKKYKYFVLAGETTAPTDIAFDVGIWNKIKTGAKLPTTFKLKYSYTNSTAAKHTVKMVRELVNTDTGKVVESKSGKWVMIVGEKDSLTITQTLAAGLAAGDYQVRIRAYDWTTKEVLSENSFGFVVELK